MLIILYNVFLCSLTTLLSKFLMLQWCKIFSHRFHFWICLFPPYVRIYILACNKIVICSMYLFNKHVLRVLKHFYLEYTHICVYILLFIRYIFNIILAPIYTTTIRLSSCLIRTYLVLNWFINLLLQLLCYCTAIAMIF